MLLNNQHINFFGYNRNESLFASAQNGQGKLGSSSIDCCKFDVVGLPWSNTPPAATAIY